MTTTDASGEGRRRLTADHLFWASLVAVLVPILVATVRAARRGWLPVGDNAYFLIRSRDVFTEHHPLLGTWTSASQNTDTNFNNPGPMMFDLLALPTKLGGGMGLGIGVAVLNALAIAGIALLARRRGGPLLGVAALAVSALLCSSLGSELLYDPWQPHSLLFPFLFGLACVWSLAAGDLAALPWALGAGSLVVQTHLSYAVLVVVLGGWGVLGLVLALRRERADDPDGWSARRRSIVKVGIISAVVVGVCWLQPVIENFTSDGQGNLDRLARNMTTSEETIGAGLGTRIVADTVVVPPFWLRPSFEEALAHDFSKPAGGDELPSVNPSAPVAAGLLLLLGVAMAAATWDARRRGDRVSSAALTTAGLALGAGLVTSWQLPFGVFGVAAHQFRWMWPVAAFTTLALLTWGLRRAAATDRRTHGAALALAGLAALVAVSTIPTYNVKAGPVADIDASATVEEANRQMAALEDEGPLLIDINGIRFAEPYTGPVMAELQRRGIPFVVDDEGMVRQLGDSRRLEEGEDAQRLLFREGDAAAGEIPGARRVVFVPGLTDAEQRERDGLRQTIVDDLVADGLRVRDLSGSSLPGPQQDLVTSSAEPDAATAAAIVDAGILLYLVDNDLLVTDDAGQDRMERYAELQHRWAVRTMGLFLAPLDWDGGA